MARQYALPKSDRNDPRGLSGYIRETAQKYGVNPEVALKVAKSEGLSSFQSGVVKNGKQEPSFGAFQLYTGGGLGNKFKKETGLDPADPANEKATIDYALNYASKHGWGSWYGAKNTGVGEWDGISGGAASAGSDKTASTDTPADATKMAGTDTSTTTPDTGMYATPATTGASTGDFIDKLQDPRTKAAEGLGEAITGLGQAVTGSSAKGFTPTAPAPTPLPVTMPTPVSAPMVNPQVVNNQRQQLALAMQRLNSGRLY